MTLYRHLTHFPQKKGKIAEQAHVGLPEGTFDDEHGRDGFFGPVTHLYRAHAPILWNRIEGPLTPRAFDSVKLTSKKSKRNAHPG